MTPSGHRLRSVIPGGSMQRSEPRVPEYGIPDAINVRAIGRHVYQYAGRASGQSQANGYRRITKLSLPVIYHHNVVDRDAEEHDISAAVASDGFLAEQAVKISVARRNAKRYGLL